VGGSSPKGHGKTMARKDLERILAADADHEGLRVRLAKLK
jgi:hypothetical protein